MPTITAAGTAGTAPLPQATVLTVYEATRAQPWLDHWPAKPLDGENLSTGQVSGYAAGQKLLFGGVAGSFDKVLYDTKQKPGSK